MRMRANITKDLVINRAAENDSGEYQCVAENIAARREGPVLKLCVKLCNYYGKSVYKEKNRVLSLVKVIASQGVTF